MIGVIVLLLPSILFAAGQNPFNSANENIGFPAQYSGQAQIEGDLALSARLSPSVAQRGNELQLQLVMVNQSDDPIAPSVDVLLPSMLSVDSNRLPSGATVNLQTQQAIWSPVINGQGGEVEAIFTFRVNGVDPAQVNQKITINLMYEGVEQQTEVQFWLGELPQGNFSVSLDQASVGQPIQLNADITSGEPVNQSWTLSDGRQIFADDPIVVFPEPGQHEITLHLTNPAGTTSISQSVLIVGDPAA